MLEINTLSNPEIVIKNKKVTDFVSRKALALVIYLAINPGSRSREELAELLWSDQSQERATGNLRVVLTDVRKKIGDFLTVDRYSVSLQAENDVWVDVHQLLNAIETHDLDWAISLYKGDFLESFYLRGASRFENWQVLEREKIRLELIDGLSETVHKLIKAGRSKDAIKYLIHLSSLEPLLESAHRQLMQAYFENGDTNLALKQFEICKQILFDELSVTPSEETLNLYSHIAGNRLIESPFQNITHNLPIFTTPFLGQTEKIRELFKIITKPEVRQLSLVGPGGYGKSRLAIHLAKQITNQFHDGVFWIPLQSLEKISELPMTMANAIGFIHLTGKDIKEELINYLSSRQTLIILDNFEHLIPGARLVTEILTRSQSVKILTTSRQKLNLQGETTFIVHGMDYPIDEETALNTNEAKGFDAIQLFIQSAWRSKPSFKPTDVDIRAIVKICKLVDGMPLAIELAAGWVPVLSTREIEKEIEKGFDFLEGKIIDLEKRHHSLQAVAKQSWQMLTDAERSVFKKLSVFKGPFSRKAAERIAGAKIHDLLALSNKSFLQKDSEGLLRVHEWLRQYGESELKKSKDQLSKVLDLYSNYYLTYLSENYWEAWSGKCQRLRYEWRNTSEALLLASRAGKFQSIGKALVSYSFATMVIGDLNESNILFNKLVVEFEKRELSDNERQTYALCLAFHALFLDSQNNGEQVIQNYEKVKIIIQDCDQNWEYAWSLVIENVSGYCIDQKRLLDNAKQALIIFTKLKDYYAVTFTYNLLSSISFGETKRDYCQQALAIARKHKGTRDIAFALLELGKLETEHENFMKAVKLLTEAYSHYASIQFLHGMVRVSRFMGILNHKQENYSQAKAYYEQAFKLSDRVGFKGYANLIKYYLGALEFALNNFDLARQFFWEAYLQDIISFGNKMLSETTSIPEVPMLLEHLGYPDLAVIRIITTRNIPYEENWNTQNEKLFITYDSKYSQEEMAKWIERAGQIKPIELAIAIRDAFAENYN